MCRWMQPGAGLVRRLRRCLAGVSTSAWNDGRVTGVCPLPQARHDGKD
ncbi:hypothetical protein DA2_2642 [Desulfovibrio sp. A2]|nr:hypothetical protein DA2_2642 [Desulfovibrio sp. A2]